MAEVTVRAIGPLRQLLGGAELVMSVGERATVAELLRRLAEEKGGEFARYVTWVEGLDGSGDGSAAYSPLRVLLNGRDIFPDKLEESVLAEGDTLLVFSPLAGG